MRIACKVCSFVAAAMLVLQAVLVFCGHPVGGVSGGVEIICIALWCASDAAWNFSKPKHPFLRFRFFCDDGAEDGFVTRADTHTIIITRKRNNPFHTMYVVFFESEKDEESNGKDNSD